MLDYPLGRPFLSAATVVGLLVLVLVAYLARLNQLLRSTPDEIRRLNPAGWTREQILAAYQRLESNPITTSTYAQRIPPKLGRRYIVTGGSGLVGGYIVLQLLERGQPPESIRIVDFRAPSRADMSHGPAARVDFVQTDISSAESTEKAFRKPWNPSVTHLPLTVFHTAAVIVPSDRSKLVYGFCEAVNVRGTQHVVDAARRAGADVLVSTTSGSISIRPVELWVPPWRMWSRSSGRWPRHYWQVLDDKDFFETPRKHEEYYANYPASKAAAERIVCAANGQAMRTGCIRPANGVYGNPTDNTVGGALAKAVLPTWTSHIVHSFAHGSNVAIAHLDFEAVLASPESASSPQAGRPFVITDPNPPISYRDLYFLIETLAATPFCISPLQPIVIVLLSYPVEWYTLLRVKYPILQKVLPELTGEVKHLKPGIFSICTHLVASNDVASQTTAAGGLGYRGVVTTLEGMTQEVIEWNREHKDAAGSRKAYQTSVSLADEIAGAVTGLKSVSGE
ncbi:3beta-hydroxysteroid-dehydrogenase/decarboxylase isoform 2 [Madurella mycetomatis]|uniref:3beta-hydroxysteroid-dehydrogenase/decarboxylase isoform 2 n=1 Tax=Madurella mycetomatis TaxID=100816 RepID=A0A175VRG8_9PEZI|nr:3beta-hydroxysteroid-dehydrogenase/decarboxylase isoform 2 [Madurella mycetomatis]